jgi:4'-phosphopantetheinyl transferase
MVQKGNPGLPKAEGERLNFNASHSGGLAVFAFTFGCEISVDVEQVRSLSDMQDIVSRFFCLEEAAELISLPAGERERAFFLCWTRKEAYIKAVGDGLSVPLNGFRITVRPDGPARFLHIRNDEIAAEFWALHNLELTPAYAGALAYRDAPRSVLLRPVINAAELLVVVVNLPRLRSPRNIQPCALSARSRCALTI